MTETKLTNLLAFELLPKAILFWASQLFGARWMMERESFAAGLEEGSTWFHFQGQDLALMICQSTRISLLKTYLRSSSHHPRPSRHRREAQKERTEIYYLETDWELGQRCGFISQKGQNQKGYILIFIVCGLKWELILSACLAAVQQWTRHGGGKCQRNMHHSCLSDFRSTSDHED